MTSTALRVKELLKEFGWTTKILAEKTGMSESYLTHIKNGTRRWNEDALKKIAEAFQTSPVDLLYNRFEITPQHRIMQQEASSEFRKSQERFSEGVAKVPLLTAIPEKADIETYKQMQVLAQMEGDCVPAFGYNDPLLFSLLIENNSLAPRFLKGDTLLVSPGAAVHSGDAVVVEYKHDKVMRGVMIITYMDDVIVLEYPHHKQPPIAMTRSDHYVKIIGKIVARYQRL